MKIKLLSASNFGAGRRSIGDIVDVADEIALKWISFGYAVAVEDSVRALDTASISNRMETGQGKRTTRRKKGS